MVRFKAILKQFGEQGEKTGWVYLIVGPEASAVLAPGVKKTFRVKGTLDKLAISSVAVMPMGGGDFILPVNARFRKALGKSTGATVQVALEIDDPDLELPKDLRLCLQDDPEALKAFDKRPKSHRHYFIRWVDSAKTDGTRARRIAAVIDCVLTGKSFAEMIRAQQEKRNFE